MRLAYFICPECGRVEEALLPAPSIILVCNRHEEEVGMEAVYGGGFVAQED